MPDASPRTRVITELQLLLGDQLVEVELDPEHYNLAVDLAITRLREYSSGATEEGFIPLTIERNVNQYQLPDDVIQVKKVNRRSISHSTGTGSEFDHFDAAWKNAYLLQGGRPGGVATWDFFHQYQETIKKVFVGEMDFIWHPGSKKLELIRSPRGQENVILNVFIEKSENALLTDRLTVPWIRSWALALCKEMLGRGRGKFTSGFAGPDGTVQMDGERLIQEAREDKQTLMKQLTDLRTSQHGLPFTIG